MGVWSGVGGRWAVERPFIGGDVIFWVLCGVKGVSVEVDDGLCCCEADAVWEGRGELVSEQVSERCALKKG